jgi:hypothetical protein
MTNDKTQQNANDQPEQAQPKQADQQERPSQASAALQLSQRVAPGRRPLFRT